MRREASSRRPETLWLPLTALILLGLGSPAAAAEAFDCVIDPSQLIKVSSPIIGLLSEVIVERGDTVTRGQIVARLESDVEDRTVALRKAQSEATARVDTQAERVALAQKTYDRAAEMGSSGSLPMQQVDELRSDLRVNELELARVQEEHEIARLELERAEASLAQRTIRSPVDGIVTARALSGGEYVDNDTYILEVANLDPLYVETFLPVAFYPLVQQGMAAAVEPPAPFSGRYEAEVLTIDRVFDSASGTFGVRLALANPDEALPAGLRCRAVFPFESPASPAD